MADASRWRPGDFAPLICPRIDTPQSKAPRHRAGAGQLAGINRQPAQCIGMVVQARTTQPRRREPGRRGLPIAAPFRPRAQPFKHHGRCASPPSEFRGFANEGNRPVCRGDAPDF